MGTVIVSHHPVWDFIEMECTAMALRHEVVDSVRDAGFFLMMASDLLDEDIEKFIKENNGHSDL